MEIDTGWDGHVHTEYCHHAVGTMDEFVRAAMARGLRGFTFLEHLEKGIRSEVVTWPSPEELRRYREEGEALKRRYQGQIEIGIGVEVGYNPRCRMEILEALEGFPWDRVGVSYHYFEIHARHYNLVSRRQETLARLAEYGVDRVLDGYFEGLREAVELLPGTVVCHLDAVLRHLPGIRFAGRHEKMISELLAAAKQKGMMLEINTSGFCHQRREPYPSREIVREALSLGMKLAPGSDAHRPGEVARELEKIESWLNRPLSNGLLVSACPTTAHGSKGTVKG